MRLRGSSLSWPLVFFLFASIINVSIGLKCYFCYGSDESGDCSLPEDEHGNRLVEKTSTMKIISCLPQDEECYKIHYSFNGKPVTGRGCGNETFCDNHRTQQNQLNEFNIISECNLCSGNLCNSSVKLSVTGRLGVLGAFLCILVARLTRF